MLNLPFKTGFQDHAECSKALREVTLVPVALSDTDSA